MKKVVYKYKLQITKVIQEVVLPLGAQILCIKMQNDELCMWALVDPDQPYNEVVKIRCAGAGHEITEDVEYIDTVMLLDGELVFHFFKVK